MSWLQNYPQTLEIAYRFTVWVVDRLDPIFKWSGYERAERVMLPLEDVSKKAIFDCKTCGVCILHSTGMTCPMTCPKDLRNGPCGGVRTNGHCEVKPEMKCVWVEAYERSQKMVFYGSEMMDIQRPLNRQLVGSSAWINYLDEDRLKPQKGWVEVERPSHG